MNDEDPKDLSPNPKIWIKDFLYEDIKQYKPRLIYTGYETFNLQGEYWKANVPELDINELASSIAKSLKWA